MICESLVTDPRRDLRPTPGRRAAPTCGSPPQAAAPWGARPRPRCSTFLPWPLRPPRTRPPSRSDSAAKRSWTSSRPGLVRGPSITCARRSRWQHLESLAHLKAERAPCLLARCGVQIPGAAAGSLGGSSAGDILRMRRSQQQDCRMVVAPNLLPPPPRPRPLPYESPTGRRLRSWSQTAPLSRALRARRLSQGCARCRVKARVDLCAKSRAVDLPPETRPSRSPYMHE